MNKLLAIINTCGISGKDNDDFYLENINRVLQQQFDGELITAVSSCLNTKETIEKISRAFGSHIYINWIHDILPVNVTFNHTVLQLVKNLGKFDAYLFVDSDILFQKADDVQNLYNTLKSGPYGMVSARTNTDQGLSWWFGHESDYNLIKDGDFILPVGKAVNGHCQIYSGEMFDFYGRIISDIFSSYCSESTLTFILAAIKQNWVLSKDVLVYHKHYMDESSSGFNPQEWEKAGNNIKDHPFIINSILERLDSEEYKRLGGGYEECDAIVMHDPNCYDEQGFCTNEELKYFIKDNLYLKKEEFDYDKINHEFKLR